MGSTRSESLKKAWKNRKDYIGADKKSSLYTSWRARVFTRKGRLAGFPAEWETFKGFKKDMQHGWREGLILVRHDPKLPFSKINCEWAEKGEENIGKLISLEYMGETKTLIEWAAEFDLNYNGIRQRFFRGKNYTKEQILFGKPFKRKRGINDHKTMEPQKRRDKISRMLSAYKLKDKRHGFSFALPREFFER